MVIIRFSVKLALLALLCLFASQAYATTIDVMVLFDTKAKSWADSNGGMQNIAAAAVAKMNAATTNSGINSLSFNLAHFQAMPNYTTSSNGNTPLDNDLDALSAGSGGLSTVPSLRTSYGADLVALLVDTGKDYGYTGIADLLSSPFGDPNSAYSVCAIRSVVLSHTLTHEVGHNLGAHHSKYQAESPGPNYSLNTYSAGWYFTGAGGEAYHTIMAYGDDGYGNSYVEVPYFSSPTRTYDGATVGHAAHGDNARTITETMYVVAGYRSSDICEAPSSISVPGSDPDGTYTVSWGASATSGVTYVLEEATNSAFSTGLRIAYSGAELGTTISGRNGGSTYYYRVKATRSGYTDSPWQVGANGCSVTLPSVATPESITVPTSDDDGSYTINWDASATSDVTYILEEAAVATFTQGLRTVYTGTGTSAAVFGRLSSTYYYRVKAQKSGYSDSAWRTGANGCVVAMEAGTPTALTVPAEDSDGSYLISWGASSTPGASYQLVEATNAAFTANTRTAYTGQATSATLSGRVSGSYYYRIAAWATGYYPSAWQTAANGCTVTLPAAGAPASITVPATDNDGTFTVSWQASDLAGVTYTLEEATNDAFSSGLRTVYSGTGLSALLSNRINGTYFYRIRAAKSGYDQSVWRTGANGCTVSLPLPAAGMVASITVPATDADGTYTIAWGGTTTFGATFVLEEATNSGFTTGLSTVYRGTATSISLYDRPGGTFYYRVKATKSGFADSAWQSGSNGCAVLPRPPHLSYSVNGLNVTVTWTAAPGADGYILSAAPYPFTGMDSIVSFDMGSATSFSAILWPGAAYYIAVQSRNIHGSSGYSNIEWFILGSP